MELEEGKLRIGREISRLDRKVLEFVETLDELDAGYVIVSGYVAILTGRSRGTEDIDMVISQLTEEETERLHQELTSRGYWCINAGDDEVFDMLADDLSVRYAEEGKAIPNFELGFPSTVYDREALREGIEVELEEGVLRISSLELQIAYKLYLGSEKDFEDALHLYELFREELDTEKLEDYARRLDVRRELDDLSEE